MKHRLESVPAPADGICHEATWDPTGKFLRCACGREFRPSEFLWASARECHRRHLVSLHYRVTSRSV